MGTTYYGEYFCFGVDERWLKLPISNLPENTVKVRLRFRNDQFAKAYIKTTTDIQQWFIVPSCVDLTLKNCTAVNSRK